MNSTYHILFTVLFKHDFFEDTNLNYFNIKVSEQSMKWFDNYGLIFKSLSNGFHVLYDAEFAGEIRSREKLIKEQLLLRFVISLKDQHFYNYTSDMGCNISSKIFHFKNKLNDEDNANANSLLHEDEFVSAKELSDLELFPEFIFHKPFGIIDISLNPNLSKQLTINFSEKKTHWKYIIVSDHLQDLIHPAIIGTHEKFEGPKEIILPNAIKAYTFESLRPIALKQSYQSFFQLVENYIDRESKYKVVIRALPVPDIKSISASQIQDQTTTNNYSEIFIN